MIDLSIIIVNWNCGQLIVDCLQSLVETIRDHTYEVIVVDNNSSDGSVENIARKYPEVKIWKNKDNVLFARANNQGYELSSGQYILILNPDTIVTEEAIDRWLAYAKGKGIGASTCLLLNRDGSVQYGMYRRFPTIVRLTSFFLYSIFPFFQFLPSVRSYLYLDIPFEKDFFVEQAPGAALLLSRKLIEKLGYLFDEKNFPLFYNDVDLCYRVWKGDERIVCKTDTRIYHLKKSSLRKLTNLDYFQKYSDSSLKYFQKHKLYLDYWLAKPAYELIKKFLALKASCHDLRDFLRKSVV